jgi:uncharacterized protein
VDRAVYLLIRVLGEGKFYSLFSFLFGLGLALQTERLEARGAAFFGLYLRRLIVLFVIGIAHAYLLWAGDILHMYALLGFLLVLFRRCAPKTLLIWVAVFLLLPLLVNGVITGMIELSRFDPQAAAEVERGFAAQQQLMERLHESSLIAYGGGVFVDMLLQRIEDVRFLHFGFLFFLGPHVFAMFLLGLYAGRRRILHGDDEHRPLLRRLLIGGFCIGVPFSAAYVIAGSYSNPMRPSWIGLAALAVYVVGIPALSFAYASAIVLLIRSERWRRRFRPLAAVGRTALSNYLLQSLICTTLFYGYGLGLYAKIGPAVGILIVVAIYSIQVPLSNWYVKRFRFGPAEWLWRTLTYGKLQPMRAPRAEPHGLE